MFLLDTNVVSEPSRPHPSEAVLRWLEGAQADRLFVSTITLAELTFGVTRLPDGPRRARLRAWIDTAILGSMQDRILPVDTRVAETWAEIEARAPKTIPAFDALIAATAIAHDLSVVTRNTRNFTTTGARLINPWAD